MTIELQEGRYFEALYFFGCDGWDVHGALYRDRTQDGSWGPWIIQYRFRYYAGPDPDDARDTKNWYSFKAPDGAPERVKDFHKTMRLMVIDVPREIVVVPFTQIDVRSDDQDVVLQKLLAQPWCHLTGLDKGGSA